MLKCYIGYDSRESTAYQVARRSILSHAYKSLSIVPLTMSRLQAQGLLTRETRMVSGALWDTVSGAPQSTEFAASRFLTPLLAQNGWALFVDSDIVALDDVHKIMEYADSRYAVMCVQHKGQEEAGSKKVNQSQHPYPRKNWSSVMLFNCAHPALSSLTVEKINTWPGRDLHAFKWLEDRYIGALPHEWNWLVNVHEKPVSPKIAHFTLGGPWLFNWTPAPYDSIWHKAAENLGVENDNDLPKVRKGPREASSTSSAEA